MFNKLLRYYHTLRYLKPVQIKYQFLYRLKKAKPLSAYIRSIDLEQIQLLHFTKEPPVYASYVRKDTFTFLNQEKKFDTPINWSYQGYGALWNYNLQYLNLLMQEDVELEEKLRLLKSVYTSGIPLEPYPVSLRSINAMRLISKENIRDKGLLKNLYAELNFLSQRLEFHLLGNHLLENLFALMMGGAFFKNMEWVHTAHRLLKRELDEQTLADGAHFELSPMYHQIIFFRVLELIDWYEKWEGKDGAFESFLRIKAGSMRAWLQNISFKNGDIPHFNDSTNGIAYSTPWLSKYADELHISASNLALKESGYRCVNTEIYELRIDMAQLGAPYQPGHAHADALSFILYFKGKPLLVEQGTSTYTIGERRSLERSTHAHNTVVIEGKNQSQIWGGFRVGKRAKTTIHIEDADEEIWEASHDGYKARHSRRFTCTSGTIEILDEVASADQEAVAYFHFSPDTELQWKNMRIEINKTSHMCFVNSQDVKIETYEYAEGFNRLRKAQVVCVSFSKKLHTIIDLT